MTSSPSSWYVNEKKTQYCHLPQCGKKRYMLMRNGAFCFQLGLSWKMQLNLRDSYPQGLMRGLNEKTQGRLGAPMTHRDNQNSNHLPRTASQPCQVYKARTPPFHHSSMFPHHLGERASRHRSSVRANCAPPFTLNSRVWLIIS